MEGGIGAIPRSYNNCNANFGLQISDKRREFFAVNGVPLFALNGVNFWFIPKFGGMNYYLLKYQ